MSLQIYVVDHVPADDDPVAALALLKTWTQSCTADRHVHPCVIDGGHPDIVPAPEASGGDVAVAFIHASDREAWANRFCSQFPGGAVLFYYSRGDFAEAPAAPPGQIFQASADPRTDISLLLHRARREGFSAFLQSIEETGEPDFGKLLTPSSVPDRVIAAWLLHKGLDLTMEAIQKQLPGLTEEIRERTDSLPPGKRPTIEHLETVLENQFGHGAA